MAYQIIILSGEPSVTIKLGNYTYLLFQLVFEMKRKNLKFTNGKSFKSSKSKFCHTSDNFLYIPQLFSSRLQQLSKLT